MLYSSWRILFLRESLFVGCWLQLLVLRNSRHKNKLLLKFTIAILPRASERKQHSLQKLLDMAVASKRHASPLSNIIDKISTIAYPMSSPPNAPNWPNLNLPVWNATRSYERTVTYKSDGQQAATTERPKDWQHRLWPPGAESDSSSSQTPPTASNAHRPDRCNVQGVTELSTKLQIVSETVTCLATAQPVDQQETMAIMAANFARKDAEIAQLTLELAKQNSNVKSLQKKIQDTEKENQELKTKVAKLAAIADRFGDTRSVLSKEIAKKSTISEMSFSLTYSAIAQRMANAPTEAERKWIKTSTFWPTDDVSTMVVTRLGGPINKRRDALIRVGLPREAIINIEPLYEIFSLLSTPTSMHEKITESLKNIHVDIVDPEAAKVAKIPGLSTNAKQRESERVAKKLTNRIATKIGFHHYVLASQLREMPAKLEIPIGTQEEVEELARTGIWRTQNQRAGKTQRRQEQQPKETSQRRQSPQSRTRRRPCQGRDQNYQKVLPAAALANRTSSPLPPEAAELLQSCSVQLQ
ncbi:hypothetical protein BX070DRAFT_258694 [Coemansia spiralis]|nr:hypothetical protein BX070DRAFT_258694 [Coemansia spiralis]